jgi:uncharacterized protein (TIGR03545 family)
MRYLRMKGLITFISLCILFAAFIYLFAESLLKTSIEEAGGWALGAEVNLEAVELNYAPLAITLIGFQATDAEEPTNNLFSFKEMSADIAVWQYLFGKVIVDDLVLTELRFNEKRLNVGEVYKDNNDAVDETDEPDEGPLLPGMSASLPDMNKVLDDKNLLTAKQAITLKSTYYAEEKKLLALKETLPDEARLRHYKAELSKLTEAKVNNISDINLLKAKYDSLKTQFKADQKQVKDAKLQVKNSKALLAKEIALMKSAPAKDWEYIEKKYQLESLDNEDFAHILFGEKARDYYQKAESYYLKVKPYITSDGEGDNTNSAATAKDSLSEGRFVYFTEDEPLPAVLIKKATLSVILPQGEFLLALNEVTHQHWLRNKPTGIKLSAVKLEKGGDFNLISTVYIDQNQAIEGKGSWEIEGLEMSPFVVRESKNLTLTLAKAKLSGTGNFTFDTELIDSRNSVLLADTQYEGTADSSLGNIFIDTFKDMEQLTLGIDITGDIASPEYDISSPINKMLKNVFKQQLNKQIEKLRETAQVGLNKKLAEALKLESDSGSEFANLDSLLTDTDKAMDDLLNSDVVKEQQKKLENKLKDQAEDKVKDKLKGKFNKLFG